MKSPLRARYEFGIEENIVWLADLNYGKSLTNDIENCVAETLINLDLFDEYQKYDIIYRDSDGTWDRIFVREINQDLIRHQLRRFRMTDAIKVDFAPLGAKSLIEAIKLLSK